MILLWGVPGDGPMDAIRKRLADRGAPTVFLDQRQASRCIVTLSVQQCGLVGEIDTPDGRLDLEMMTAAYLRPVETERALRAANLAPGRSAVEAAVRATQVDLSIVTWADLANALVVNRPLAMADNNSKPHQLRQVAACGFSVPETLITTDPDRVREFVRRHNRIIYKSVSGVRSIVNTLGPDELDRLADVANLPTQFQRYVAGTDYRVHVVGDQVFPTRINSAAADYRYACRSGDEITMAAATIPDAVASRCRDMTTRMGLHVAGIDLRCTPDDDWVCFEVNPSPAFVFYEQATAQPIGDAIADLLAGTAGVVSPRA